MQDLLTDYATFYKDRHQGHKLEWDHALGTATLKARFKASPKDLSVSLYQSLVLLLFNDATELSYTDIKDLTSMGMAAIISRTINSDDCFRIDEKELRRTLQSLACGTKKVLKKRPVGKDVDDQDVFYFNADFTDPRAKLHINSIQSKETVRKRLKQIIDGLIFL